MNLCSSVLAISGVFLMTPLVWAEWGGVGGMSVPEAPTVLNPTATDTDGDGIPNAWEDANLLDKTHPADALSDFDMDGLTALQEYQLSLATGGQYGNPLGKWTAVLVPRPQGFIVPLPSTTLIECASNGIILVRAEGVLTGTTTSTSYPYTWSPETGTWTRIAAPDGFSSVTSLTPLDVNSSGQVVGYFNSGGTKGFIWTPDENGGHTSVYHLNSGGTQTDAIPTRISDSGYIVGYEGSLGGRSIAATASGTEIIFPDMEVDPVYRDVNDYGEFIGTAYNPYTWKNEIFLAAPGYPIFLTGIEQDAFDGGPEVWGLIPDIDPSAITWLSEGPMDGWYRGGIAIDRTTGLNVDVREGYGAEFYWHSNLTEYSGAYWYGYPGFSQMVGAINDWGEFSGTYSGWLSRTSFTFSSYYEEHEDVTYYYASQDGYDSLTDDGIFFYDGHHHVSKALPSVYGISNDPRVLTGTPFALWSGSQTIPISRLMPAGFPTVFESARLADNGNVILHQSFNTPIHILKPAQDSDGDGMPDDWEKYYGFNPNDPLDAVQDPDQDGLCNLAEFLLRSDPLQVLGVTAPSVDLRPGIDTDGDGLPNVWEWKHGFNYNDASDAASDLDGDGLTILKEFLLGTDPNDPDTDNDGVSDGKEALENGTNPLVYRDLDNDGMPDDWELDFCHRLLAHRDVLTPEQIATLQTNNLDSQTDILAEGISNLQRSHEEIDSPNTASSPDRVFVGKTRSIIYGQIHDGPPEYYPQERGSGLWMAPYESYHDSFPGNISTADNIISSSPGSTFGELDYSLPWDALPWWTSGSADTLYGAGWPLMSSQKTWSTLVSAPNLPDITVTECLFGYSESMLRMKAKDISEIDRSYSYYLLTQSASIPPDEAYTWMNPHVEIDSLYKFTIPAGKTLSQTVQAKTPLKEGLEGISKLLPVQINEVSFAGSNYHELKSDDTNTTYNAPQWLDVNSDSTATTNTTSGEKNYPVAFTRHTKPKVGAKFKVGGLPAGQTVTITATSTPVGVSFTSGPLTPDSAGMVTLPLTESSTDFVDSIQFYNATDTTAFEIKWELKIGSGNPQEIGKTKHTVFLTLVDPAATLKSGTGFRETLFWLACHNPIGQDGSNMNLIQDKIYGEFSSLEIKKFNHKIGAPEGSLLTYTGTPIPGAGPDKHVLVQGTGVCWAWSKFLKDVCEVHGIASIITDITPKKTGYTLQSSFEGAAFLLKPVVAPPGAGSKSRPAKSNPDDQGHAKRIAGEWPSHTILNIGSRYFDPSYGTKGDTLPDWEDASISCFRGTVPGLLGYGSRVEWFMRNTAAQELDSTTNKVQ